MGKRNKQPKKRGKHHGRCCPEAERSMKWLESLECVIKVILGRSEACRHHYVPGTIRFTSEVLGGIYIKVYGSIGVIDGYVQVSDTNRLDLENSIKERFPT